MQAQLAAEPRPSGWSGLIPAMLSGGLPAGIASMLVGGAAGLQFCGFRTLVAAEIDPLSATASIVGVLALLWMAVGAALPERIMGLIRGWLAGRMAGENSAGGGPAIDLWLLQISRPAEAALPWLCLAVLSSAVGLVALAGIAICGPAFQLYHWLLRHFFWNNLSLAGLEWAGLTLLMAVPCSLYGTLVVTLAATRPRTGGDRPVRGLPGGVLLGAGLAWLAHRRGAAWGLSSEREIMIGSLPLFVMALACVLMSQREEDRPLDERSSNFAPPELSFGREVLVRLSAVVWALASALTFSAWLACGPGHGTGTLLAGAGLAYAVCSWWFADRELAGSHGGSAIWLSGVAAGLVGTLSAWWPDSRLAAGCQPLLLVLTAGYALYRLNHSLLARSSGRTLGFAHASVALLTGGGLGLAAGRWLALPELGPMGAMAAGSLLLLAMGGLLELHEEEHPTRSQLLRLGLVFASLAAAITLFPGNTRAWTRRARETAAPAPTSIRDPAVWEPLAQARTACLIDVAPETLAGNLPPLASRVSVLPLVEPWPTTRAGDPRDRLQVGIMPAPRALRLHHEYYQFIFQAGQTGPTRPTFAYSAEWLSRLRQHLAPGGTLIVEVPFDRLARRDILTIAATFRFVMPEPWTCAMTAGGRDSLFLRCGGNCDTPGGATAWHRLEVLFGGSTPPIAIHSIRRPRLAGRPVRGLETAAVRPWLAARLSGP